VLMIVKCITSTSRATFVCANTGVGKDESVDVGVFIEEVRASSSWCFDFFLKSNSVHAFIYPLPHTQIHFLCLIHSCDIEP